MTYLNNLVPEDYKCGKCGATNVKLWREYNTFSPQLLCANCASKDQKLNTKTLNAEGKWLDKKTGMWCDQIGWYVPAVPTEDGLGYWAYTSVPDEGVIWWRLLPTRSNEK